MTATAHCWALQRTTGPLAGQDLADIDGFLHFADQGEASAYLAGINPTGAPAPVRMDRPCHVLVCACGTQFGHGGTHADHYATAAAARASALDSGWTPAPYGWKCPRCSA